MKLCTCLLLSFMSLTNAYSQKMLCLDDCRDLAIENNKHLKIADQEIRVAHYHKKEALAKFFPELSFSGSYLRNQKNLNIISSSSIPSHIAIPDLTGAGIPFPGADIPLPPEFQDKLKSIGEVNIKNVWLGGLNLVQPLFMGGKIVAYNDIQKYAEELAKLQKDTKLSDVIVEVDNSYWQVVSLSSKKKLADSYVALLTKMESDIAMMENEGLATKADRLTVSVKLNEAEVTQTKVENGLMLAKMYLNQVCGIEESEAYTLRDELSDNLNTQETDGVVPNFAEVFSDRKEVKSLELVNKIYKKKEKIEFSEFLPQVGLTANYLWTNPNPYDGFDKKFGGMWNVGVVVKVPLSFYGSSAKLSAAKAQTLISQLQLEEVKEKIELQVNQSVYKVNEANKKLRMTSKNVEKANENLLYANAGFEEGVISAADALSAHTAWISAHSEQLDAQIDVKLSKLYLDKAFGRTLYK